MESALTVHGLDDVLRRICEWWQVSTGAEEVLVGAATGDGTRFVFACCRAGESVELLSPDDAAIEDLSRRLQEPSVEVPVQSNSRSVILTREGRPIGAIELRGSEAPPPDPDPDWISASTSLLANAAHREVQLRDEKLASLAEFAAGAGHEINNPLATILICSQRLQRLTSDPEQHRLLATIGGQALRVRDMIGDVMLFARPPAPQFEALDLAAAVGEVLARFDDQVTSLGIDVTFTPPPLVTVRADPTQVRVVVSELLKNAIECQPDGGRIEVVCGPESDQRTGFAELTVCDAGPGLDSTSRRHLFDPYFSGRPAGRGLGFGLSKVWRIVELHGGRVGVCESRSAGLQVTVHWPAGSRLAGDS